MNSKTTTLCILGSDLSKWQDSGETSAIAAEVIKLPADNQVRMMEVLSAMVCQLEKD